MKVLQLIQKPQLRGAEMFACQLSEQLNSLGHEAFLVPLFQGNAELPFRGKIVCLDANLSSRLADLKAWRKLAKIIKEENPDIIQANAGDTLKYAVFSKLFFRWKQPIVFRNASTISRYIKSSIVKQWNNWLYRHAAYVISVSENSRADFISLFPAVRNRIGVIPIGIDNQPLPAKQVSDQPTLIHVGGFTFEKNHERLLHIFKNLQERVANVRLWLVGDGPLRKKIEEKVKQMDLSEQVFFLGPRKDAITLMQQAQALILPSIIEGLPAVVLEAFYVKTPVVAYNVGGIGEIVKKDTGWLIEKGQEDSFVRSLVEILNHSDLVSRKVENAFELATKTYDNKILAEKFSKVYEEVNTK